jgi:hypothetical protein
MQNPIIMLKLLKFVTHLIITEFNFAEMEEVPRAHAQCTVRCSKDGAIPTLITLEV